MDIIYIPFGSDCSIAYHLQQLNLRQYAFPFDWILSDIPNIIKCLKNNFSNFIDIDYLKLMNISNNFPLIDDDWPQLSNKTNNVKKYKHKLYNFIFPHDFTDNCDIKLIIAKYERRIERFNIIMKNPNITKIILYIGKKNNNEKLENIFNILEFTNFRIKNKLYSEMGIIHNDWKRNNFDWKTWFTS